MKIVFMGTPEFAVSSLRALADGGFEIAGVVTSPDRPAGRGLKMRASAVKEFAVERGYTILQPSKLKDESFLRSLRALHADLFVVVAFRMLPEVVWGMPPKGTFNLHASLLPDYRGAAPINWVLINGEVETGATTFFIDKKIDTGEILLQEKIGIADDWTAGELHDHLMVTGAQLVLETAKGIKVCTLEPMAQNDALFIHKAPKIHKEDCEIDWNRPMKEVYNFIRGLSPYPCARTQLDGKTFKVYKVLPGEPHDHEPAGMIKIAEDSESMWVSCSDGYLELREVQLEGKKRMETKAFLMGYKGAFVVNSPN